MIDWSIWATKVEAVENFFADYQLEEEGLVNELARFKVLDTLLTTDPNAKTYGLTQAQLWELANRATTEVFGIIPFAEKDFGRVYWTGLDVSPFVYLEWLALQGKEVVLTGEEQRNRVCQFANKARALEGIIVFGDVENYLSLVEEILNMDWSGKVVLQTNSQMAYELLCKMYPLATIVMSYPTEEVVANFAVSLLKGPEQSKEMANVMRLAERLSTVLCASYTELYLTGSVQYAPLDKSNFFKLLCADPASYLSMIGEGEKVPSIKSALKSISYLLPENVLAITFEEGTFKKVDLSIVEVVEEKEKVNHLIPLPAEQIREIPHFSMVNFALQLNGLSLSDYGATKAFGTDLQEGVADEALFSRYIALWELLADMDVYIEAKALIEKLLFLPKSHDIAYEGVLRPEWPVKAEIEAATQYYEALEAYEKEQMEVEERLSKKKDLIWQSLYEK